MSRTGGASVVATLVGVAAVACAAAVTGVPAPIDAQPRSEHVEQRELRLASPWGEQQVLVITPRRASARRWPVVVALHGQGEARRGPDRGFLGWSVDYHLPDAFGALARGRLTTEDYGGFVRPEHLASVNRTLGRDPWDGLVVVCPYTPDLMPDAPGSERIREYAAWVAGPLLARVRADVPQAARGREGTGIDGVSLGGMVALEVGLRHPDAFGSVGALQPAIRGREEAIAALGGNGAPQHLRLLTSDGDPFRAPTQRLSEMLRARRVAHDLAVVPGPHDYAFNRGPGALEMLLFHERVLAHEDVDPTR